MRQLCFVSTLLITMIISNVGFGHVPSPRYGMFELKFGPYTPNVDQEPGLTGQPYKQIFKDDSMFLTSIELDWQFLILPGVSVAVGGSMGFMQSCAKSETASGEQSADYTCLNVMPFAALSIVRIDALADYVGIPLVPYFKFGMNWYLWWILGGGETVSSGGTLGWQINPGIALRLDGFDRMSARTIDNEVGVNHSYLFFEFFYGQVEGLGRGGYMYLSPANWGSGSFQIGLGLEF